MKYGFITPEIKEDNHILGGVGDRGKTVLNRERDWRPFLPVGEIQRRAIETSSCTSYGTLNGLETLEKKLFGHEANYSERFSAIGSGNTEDGNDPHIVCEFIRKSGCIDESLLPFTDEIQSWQEFMTPNPLTRKLLKEGKRWVKQRTFKHEWIAPKGTDRQERLERIKDALYFGPVGVSVDAWKETNGVYYKEDDAPDNHWTLLIALEDGYPIIYDSYEDDGTYLKKLSKTYDFGFAKLFTLEERKLSFLDKILC